MSEAFDDAFTTDELSLVTGNVFDDNGSGADDPDGGTLVIAAVNGDPDAVGTEIVLPSGAKLTLNADGSFSYDPNGAFEYTPTYDSGGTNTPSGDTFSYTLAGGGTATAVITIDGVDNNDTVLGSDDVDVLTGGVGDDLLFGLDGDDLIRGRAGNDYIDGGDGFDRAGYYHVNEAAGGVHVDLTISGPQDTGSQGWDTLTSIEYVSGTPFADVLIGDDNDNVLWGSTATIDPGNWVSTSNNDTLDGGGGNDLLVVGIGNHSLAGGEGIDTVGFTENFGDDPAIRISLALQGQAQDTGQGLWTLKGIENLSGGDDNDELTGDDNDNILAGSAGDDFLSGGGGNDRLYGDGLIDTSAPASGAPTLYEDIGANGNDTLEGGTGDDELYGGGGIDTASYEHASGGVQVVLYKNGGGNGDSTGADGEDLLSGIENLTGSAFNDSLAGNNLDNVIIGGAGDDGLRGNGGNDTIYGGEGNDFINGSAGDDYIDGGAGFDRAAFFEDATPAGVTVDLRLQGQAQDTGQGMDTLVNIENVSGSVYGDHLTGDDGDNQLWGSVGGTGGTNNDTLDGQGGNDLLVVGIGNHSLTGGSGIDTVRFTENGGPETGITLSLLLAGQAQVTGNGDWTLSGIENLSGSIADDHLTGDDSVNVLAGDSGNDLLEGGGGNDTLYGDGAILVNAFGSGQIETFADVATLGGADGNDTLDGGAGDDQLYGGGGSDTASFASETGGVQAFLYNSGFGEAFAADGYDQLHDIENLTGSAFNDVLYGNNQNNVVSGGDGIDLLRGFAGNDTLQGGSGDDYLDGGIGDDILDGGDGWDRLSYFGSATGPVTVDLRIQGVAQNTGQGNDTLIGIEHVGGTSYGDTLTGNDGDNIIRGSSDGLGSPVDHIDGQGGNDLISDGAGDHVLDGGAGTDTFAYEALAVATGINVSLAQQGSAQNTGVGNMTLSNFENVTGTSFSDNLTGDGNANVLAGDIGNDTLNGGAGNDALYGDGRFYMDTHNTGLSGPIAFVNDSTSMYVGGVSGDDTLEGGLGDDLLNGGGGTDTASYLHASGGVTVDLSTGTASGADGNDTLVSIENVTGSAFGDSITGNFANNILDGRDGDDLLIARGGDDSLYGGNGNDFLSAGLGNDLINGGDGFDRAAFSQGATSGVTVDLRIQGVAQNTGLGNDTLIGIEYLSGSIFGDVLIGDDNNNYVWGVTDSSFPTADTIDGQGGDDLIEVGAGDHIVTGGTGNDTLLYNPFGDGSSGASISLALQGAAQNTGAGSMTLNGFENLSGGDFGDTLTGDGNANVLGGALGDDTLVGGAGNDSLYGDGMLGVDSPNGGSGPITFFSDVGVTFGLTDGNDTLEGGLGDDLINGGGGNDTASYEHASGGVTVDLGGGYAEGADGNDTLVNIENVIGSAFADEISGDGGSNTLDGGAGNDFIQGAAGNDTIYGGDGDDFLLGDYGENNISFTGNDILYGGNGNDGLRGGLGDDQLYGGSGNDLLRGNGGVDYFDGGTNDGADFNGIGDRVSFYERRATQGAVADLRTGIISNDGFGNVETMVGIESLGADTAYIDTFYGNDAANYLAASRGDYLYGFGGDDQFAIGAAAAVIDGGAGIDNLYLSTIGGWLTPDANSDGLAELAAASISGWVVNLSTGAMTDGYGNGGTVTGIENVWGSELGDVLTGDASANSLNGLDGNDTLEGGLGNDTLDGGNGTDTVSYAHASGAVTVTLTATGGTATGADGSDTLVSIENVTGSAFNDVLTGNNNANTLDGSDGHDRLSGAGGNDILLGGLGDDSLDGGAGDDTLDGGAGFDRVTYNNNVNGVTVNLNLQGSAQNTGRGLDTLIGIEHVNGTVFADTIIGDGGDNWLWGFATSTNPSIANNNDYIDGGAGNDLIWAGNGNQTLIGGTGIDTVMYNENFSSDQSVTISLALQGTNQTTGQGTWNISGFENLVGGNAADVLTGDGNDNIIGGGAGNDILVGGAGNDTLWGDGEITIDSHGGNYPGPIINVPDVVVVFGGVSGNDLMEGGLGNDTLDGGGGIDTATYEHASGSVTVNLNTGFASGADGNDTLANIENVIGSQFDDNITGSTGGNAIDGLGGNDNISGGAGDDTIHGGDGNDFLNGDLGENNISVSGNDVLYGDAGNDNLRGGLGNDVMYGGTGNDLFRGNGGVDSFDGGADDGEGFNGIGDRVSFFEQRATQGAVADLRTGIISNDGFGNAETMVGIESLGADTAYVDTFYGNDGRNYLAASRGDYLYGFGGDDLFAMGAAVAVVDGGTGIDRLSVSTTGGWLTADADSDGFAESAAAATSGWVVNLGNGTLVDGYGYTGSITGIENVDGSGLGDTLVGDLGLNVLNGLDGNDTLEGGQGNDTLDGGNGTDTASYAHASGSVTVTLTGGGAGTSSGADGIDVLAGIENLTGGGSNDALTGDSGNNVLDGGAGSDFIIGGLGNDTIIGGAGVDRAGYYQTNAALGGVTVTLVTGGTGTATGSGGTDTLTGIENVSGTAFADNLTGDSGNNWLWGSAATYQSGASTIVSTTNNDRLDGGAGNDLLTVGKGNQILIGGTGNDTVRFTENGAAENNLVVSLATTAAQNTGNGTWTITGVENLSGGIGNDTLTGDDNNNVLAGDSGGDTLNGGIGNDTLYGDGLINVDVNGVTTIYGDGAASAGVDILSGGDGNDFLYGGGGNDVLKGDKDDDTLYGGTGNDTLTGGQGNDRYVIEGNSGADTISGFAHLVDTIVFDDSSGVTSFAQLTLTKVGSNTMVTWGNGNSITLTGLKPTDVSAADFQFNPAAAGYEHVSHDFATGYATPHDIF